MLALFKPRVYRRQIPARSLGAVPGRHRLTPPHINARYDWLVLLLCDRVPRRECQRPFPSHRPASGRYRGGTRASPARTSPSPRQPCSGRLAAMEGDGAGDDRTWDGGRLDRMVRQLLSRRVDEEQNGDRTPQGRGGSLRAGWPPRLRRPADE